MSDHSQEPVEIECAIVCERVDSIAIWTGDYLPDGQGRLGDRKGRARKWIWLPRSEILDRSDGLGDGFVTIPLWLAEDRDLTDCAAEHGKEQGRLL